MARVGNKVQETWNDIMLDLKRVVGKAGGICTEEELNDLNDDELIEKYCSIKANHEMIKRGKEKATRY